MTLVFLGQTDAERVADLMLRIQRAASRHTGYATRTGDAGGRVDDRPTSRRGGVAWLRLAEGGHETAELALDVDAALLSGTYDERHPPRPHLTVARNVHRADLDALREVATRLDVRWITTRIVLFRSHTGPRGSRYEELASFGLRMSATLT